MNLGGLIDALSAIEDKDRPVRFDDGTTPTTLLSWRGDYAQLTLTSTDRPGNPCRVRDLLERAEKADGASFEGYKGGTYMMGRHTALWADEWGEYDKRGILGVEIDGPGYVVLRTADLSDY